MTLRDCWDLAGRDVVPDLEVRGAPRDVGAALLYAMLRSDGAEWAPPYKRVRENLAIRHKVVAPELQDQADSRLRTYKKLYEGLGLLYDQDGFLRVTAIGQRLREALESMFAQVDEAAAVASQAARWKLARLGVTMLSRYQLRNPATENEYPADTDILPLWAIWKTMRELDDKIHWEEIGRVLTKCLKMSDLQPAIVKIRKARENPSYDPADSAVLKQMFGDRCPDLGADQQDRIIVWLSRAGFKNVLIEHRNRSDGFRYLNEEFLPLIDDALASSPTQRTFATQSEYVKWLGAPPEEGTEATEALISRIMESARSYGQKAIIALVGPAGTGKTMLAEEAARRLVDSDETRWQSIQFHAGFTYEEFMGGLAPNEKGGFERQPGVLLEMNRRATESDLPHVLVVDELSRADIANVLGELLTYVEYRERPFRVAALGEQITLSSNLIVIGTLNPYDRSVINLDDAVVRRLRQIEIAPDVTALKTILDDAGMAKPLRDQLVDWFSSLPADAPFGHALFMGVRTERDLHALWQEQLRFFLRRGGIATYPSPALIESGFVWRDKKYALEAPGVATTAVSSAAPATGASLSSSTNP